MMSFEKSLPLYEQLVSRFPQVERKGKTMPYTSLNGHMFSFLDKAGKMGLRLSSEDRLAFIEEFKSSLMEQHGRIMKEYVVIPEKLLKDTNSLEQHLEKSLNYVAALKPKPSKKK